MELDDLGLREMAPGLGREAHHEDGAECEVRRDEARDRVLARQRVERGEVGRRSARVVPTTAGTAG